MPPVDPPQRALILYRAMLDATTVREMVEIAEELHGVVGHWIKRTRESQSRQLEADERAARELAERIAEIRGEQGEGGPRRGA